MDTDDFEKAEEIFRTCWDMLNDYHMRDKSLIDDAREKWKLNNLK